MPLLGPDGMLIRRLQSGRLAGEESVANPTSLHLTKQAGASMSGPSLPSSPSGTSWGSPAHHRTLRCSARLVTVGVLTTLGLAVGAVPSGAATTYNPAIDPYSMAATTASTGAQAWWSAGYTGKGIDVALIDTGVAPVEGLDTEGKVINGPDLSLESQAPNLTNLDTNGHGTFMAGLIAGHDSDLTAPYTLAAPSVYRGIAPNVRIVSLKVATADGGVDVSQVIAAIDWVVQHKNDHGMNIRVLNLSYGTNSSQSSLTDPLSYAVEQAWNNGIVVVAAAGNTGYQVSGNAPGISDPAYNPFVIGVGGYDTAGTVVPSDDFVGAYSASGTNCSGSTACKGPDFVAVGSHLQGLRVPNSYIDTNHPEGQIADRYLRGSGTSEAAAITSGSIALILQKYPTLTPDTVKKFITSNRIRVGGSAKLQGGGEIALPLLLTAKPTTKFVAGYTPATGSGTLEAARGTDHLTADGVVLTGEQDIFGQPFDSAAMAAAEAAGSSWSGGNWNGHSWSGSSWSGNCWSGSSWSGSSWSGHSWSGSSWSGDTWDGHSWSGSSWSGSSWSGSSWSGHSWSDSSWS